MLDFVVASLRFLCCHRCCLFLAVLFCQNQVPLGVTAEDYAAFRHRVLRSASPAFAGLEALGERYVQQRRAQQQQRQQKQHKQSQKKQQQQHPKQQKQTQEQSHRKQRQKQRHRLEYEQQEEEQQQEQEEREQEEEAHERELADLAMNGSFVADLLGVRLTYPFVVYFLLLFRPFSCSAPSP